MSGIVRTAPRRAIYSCKTLVGRSPSLSLPIARLRGEGHGEPFDPDVDIVIEGYPRSANTFSVHAFRDAQDRPVRIAHHVHAPAQIIAAARAHVPALMLIRDPEDAVLEFVIAKGYVTIRQALHGYVRFYTPLLRYRGRFVVGHFRDVTSDFGAVIGRVNVAFGTSFHEFAHTEENVRSSFEAIEADWETRLPLGSDAFERKVSRPSETRDRLKEQLRETYRVPGLAALRRRAEHLQAAFSA